MVVNVIKGDVTAPLGYGRKIIAHVVNDLGIMGSGVAGALRRKWPEVGNKYEDWCSESSYKNPFVLGRIQYVRVTPEIVVCNMIAQRGVGGETIDDEFVPPIKYECLGECLLRLRAGLKKAPGANLHIPMFGAGLAGGDWNVIYYLIRDIFAQTNVELTVYAFDEENLKLATETQKAYKYWKKLEEDSLKMHANTIVSA